MCNEVACNEGGTWRLDRWLPSTSKRNAANKSVINVGHGKIVAVGICSVDEHIVRPEIFGCTSANYFDHSNQIPCSGHIKRSRAARTGCWLQSSGRSTSTARRLWRSTGCQGEELNLKIYKS